VSAPPRDIYVVSHTHWDREWYHSAPRFRQRLVALVDALLASPDDAPFLLDGQGITLRDYLSVRPEREPALRQALQSGRLEAGPWYVLADNLIPSGEAIVRNLEAGRRVLRAFGAEAPAVAYCPDTFGHPAALPQIALGFGLPVAVVWRGAGGAAHPACDAWWWRGADGTRVLVHHLPPDGYEFGSALPAEAAAAARRWDALRALYAQRCSGAVALLLNGADHHARQPDIVNAVAELQQAAGASVRLHRASLRSWATAFAAEAAQRQLPEVRGELRDSYGYTWTLGGTLSTRAYQKRRNARLERGLTRDVEPWMALAALHQWEEQPSEGYGAITMAQLPALLNRAWEDLLSTHPHDTLCGCSVDDVARAMDVQQLAVADQGRGLRDAALQQVLRHDVVAARSRAPHERGASLVLRNRTARPRGGLALLTTRAFVRDVAVGPGSAAVHGALPDSAPPSGAFAGWLTQPVSIPRARWDRRESPQHYPDNDLVSEQRVLAWVPSVPALGLAAYRADALIHGNGESDTSGHGHLAPLPTPVSVARNGGETILDNGLVQLRVSAQGQVHVQHGERVLQNVLSLMVARDTGDSYTPAPHAAQRLDCVKVVVRERGPLRAAVSLTWHAPRSRHGDAREGLLYVTTTLRLSAASEWVECVVEGTNNRTNHRLRLVWHTDVGGGDTFADASFGPVRRERIVAPPHAVEHVPDGMPLHRWLMTANAHAGATLLSDGLAEGHVQSTVQGGDLSVTLLRSVGELSVANLAERPGHAGWPASIPDAQCQGPFRSRVALLLHGAHSDATLARVRDAADDLLLPLVGESWRDLDLPAPTWQLEGPTLVGDALEASAVTLAQSVPGAVVLRAVNCTDVAATGAWMLPVAGEWTATRCRLDETPLTAPIRCGGELSFVAAPREIVTWLVSRSATH
jgi:alpha-mannosidase